MRLYDLDDDNPHNHESPHYDATLTFRGREYDLQGQTWEDGEKQISIDYMRTGRRQFGKRITDIFERELRLEILEAIEANGRIY